MVDPHASRFWQAAEQHGLITPAGLEACWAAIPQAKRTADAIDRRLARQAVAAGHLSLWQAQQVLAGRAVALRVDRYLLLDLIGQGGMGRVYLARDTRLNRKVALKIISKERMNNPRAVARFEREGRVGAQLQHENLVRIYDEGTAQGTPYLVMEYIEGKNVGQILAEGGPMPPATAAKIARQVALGLQHAQEKGLIHRDVNPQNILVTRDGTAKLTDLGLALDLGDLDDMVTRDGATVGTFDYIAPEQARHSRAVDTRSDIYSLGCTLYHMIAGQVPFPGPSLPEKLYAHQLTEPQPLTALVPGLPAGLDEIVRRMMKKAMEERYQSPLEVAQALEPYAASGCSIPEIPAATALLPAPTARNSSSGSHPGATAGEGQAPTRPAASSRVKESSGSATPDPVRDPVPVEEAAPASPGLPWLPTEPDPQSSGLTWRPTESTPESVGLAWRPTETDPVFSGLLNGPGAPAGKDPLNLGLDLPLMPSLKTERPAAGSWQPMALLLALLAAVVLVVSLAILARGVVRTWTRPRAADPTNQTTSAPIVIRWNDNLMTKAEDFQEALNRAADRGVVLLSGPGSIPLPPKLLEVPRGRVTIRAAVGQRPTLDARMPARGPLFRAKSGSTLTLSGLQIAVEPPARFEGEPAPLIEAGGNLTLENCIIWCKRPVRDSGGVLAQGNVTNLTGCLFQDFDRPVILNVFHGAQVELRQCILAYTKAEDNAPRSAVKVRYQAAQNETASRLVMDHCTVAIGEGSLVDVEGIWGEEPFEFRVTHTLVRAGALLLWRSLPAEFPKAMSWSGEGNRYDVRKAYWVVIPPTGLDGLPNGPTDQASWEQVAGVQEQDLQTISAQWANPGASATGIPDPSHFILANPTDAVGADPMQVGPAAASLQR